MFFRRELVHTPTFTLTIFSIFSIMKTLQKLTLMAFAILSAGAANAQTQCSNCTPPTIVRPPAVNRPDCPNCATTSNQVAATRLAVFASQPLPDVRLTNSSSVFQDGDRQYACVEQIFGDNVAGLVQSPTVAGGGRNDAYQYQYNPTTNDNRMYGAQSGSDNLLVQRQSGGGNYARAEQSGNNNVGAQSQGDILAGGGSSTNNAAIMRQQSDNNASIQYQRGSSNYSDVAQYNINGNWSATTQLGTNNRVVVNQH